MGGAICCRSGAHQDRQGDGGNSLFVGPYNTGRGLPQILFLGPEGGGKTTLMYSTVIPGWSSIATEMVPTQTFHYEEIMRANLRFGLWEVSGAPTMQALWPLFYRFIAFDALVFVVSVLDAQLALSKVWIRRLINEDELRRSLIIVIINSFDQGTKELDVTLNDVVTSLGLEEIPSFLDNPDRFRWFVINAKDGERDSGWQKVIAWVTTVIHSRHYAASATQQQSKDQATPPPPLRQQLVASPISPQQQQRLDGNDGVPPAE